MADTLTSPMHVEVMSPDGAVFTADSVDMVVAHAADGEFAVMKGHLPLVLLLLFVLRAEAKKLLLQYLTDSLKSIKILLIL